MFLSEVKEKYPEIAHIDEWIDFCWSGVCIDGTLSLSDLQLVVDVISKIQKDFFNWHLEIKKFGVIPEEPYGVSWEHFLRGLSPEESYHQSKDYFKENNL